jgi:hypothetical protein
VRINKYSIHFGDYEPTTTTEAWRMMNRTYWHLRNLRAPIEATRIADEACQQLFHQMNEELA